MSTNNKISNLVYSQLPFFVRNDHPNFVAFMEAYFEYLEQDVGNNIDGKAIERGKNLPNYIDVDKTIGIFSDKLYSHFLHLMPKDTLADKDKLIKRILDFYRARGTEKAAKFLIRILFNEDLDFYYPKSDILKASDGKWFIERNINIQDVAVNNVANSNVSTLDYFVQRMIYGATSNSSAAVDRISRSVINGVTTDKLFLSYIKGRFLEGEGIYTRVPFGSNTLYLTANVSYNGITNIVVTNKGSLYNVGDYILIESANSVNVPANAQITIVSKGEIYELDLIKTGAGFQVGNQLEFIEAFGSNANGSIISVLDNNFYHPNSYNLISSTIQLEANTPLNNAIFSNLNTSIVSSPNVNSVLSQVFNTVKISGLGPILQIKLNSMGSEYRASPVVDAKSNTMLRELGILGKMDIITGGENYQIGDTLIFTNPTGFPGFGAAGNVRNVSATGRITEVGFTQYNNELIGGSGYIDTSTQQPRYPVVSVSSGTGSGASIRVTALMGDGEKIHAANNSYGGIEEITINESGYNYIGTPTINLQSLGGGTAQAYPVMSTGFEASEGRYLNDDGFISAYNFLQDRDYYQNYSYVMIVKQNLKNYRDTVRSLLHPVGMKMFGEYDFISESSDNAVTPNIVASIASTEGTYVKDGLKIYLDASDERSYSNVATGVYFAKYLNTWRSLVSNTTLWLGLTDYDANNSGSIVFGYAQFASATSAGNFARLPMPDVNANNTMSFWIKRSSNISDAQTLYGGSNGYFIPRYQIRFNGTSLEVIKSAYAGGSGNTFAGFTSAANQIYNIAVTANKVSNTYTLYVNGSQISTAVNNDLSNFNTSEINQGLGYCYTEKPSRRSEHFDGNMYSYMFYDRILDASEIQQNFDAFRGRFGL